MERRTGSKPRDTPACSSPAHVDRITSMASRTATAGPGRLSIPSSRKPDVPAPMATHARPPEARRASRRRQRREQATSYTDRSHGPSWISRDRAAITDANVKVPGRTARPGSTQCENPRSSAATARSNSRATGRDGTSRSPTVATGRARPSSDAARDFCRDPRYFGRQLCPEALVLAHDREADRDGADRPPTAVLDRCPDRADASSDSPRLIA